MYKVPNELRYTRTHEWVRAEGDGTFVIGITDYAQTHFGELVFVEVPDLDIHVHASDEVCVIESVKTASTIYSPLSGRIIAVNEDLSESPNLVNSDPYHDGWLYKIEADDTEEFMELLDDETYSEHMKSEEE